MTFSDAHIGFRLRLLRLAKGESDFDIGRILCATATEVRRIEKGLRPLTFVHMYKLHRYYGVELSFFYTNHGGDNPAPVIANDNCPFSLPP